MDFDGANAISVCVRVRPFTDKETSLLAPTPTASPFIGDGSLSLAPSTASTLASHRGTSSALRPIVRVLDDRVLVLDPADANPLAQAGKAIVGGGGAKKSRDLRFCFDRVFGPEATQADVFEGAAKDLVTSVLAGYNSTVFAYGATACGKTHTISGTPSDPGIVYLLMREIFDRMAAEASETTTELSVAYLELFNESLRDLLADPPSSASLNMREQDGRVVVPGLSEHTPKTAEEVIGMIHAGNLNRTVASTEANATSSRSHAVMTVSIRRKSRTADISEDWSVATLSVIDRASATKNDGERLREGANINRSLLALGSCINALCDPKRRAHVPYRDSKLTRLLKHSLGGNCKTSMVVCVSPSSAHFDETHNTLQYANRAKNISTKVTRNVVSVDRHVSQYVRVIFELRQELAERKKTDGGRDEAIRAAERKAIDGAQRESDEAIRRLRKPHEEACATLGRSSRSRAELQGLEALQPVLLAWRAAALLEDQSDPAIDALEQSLVLHGRSLFADASNASTARATFTTLVAGSRARLSSTIATRTFEREVRSLDLELDLAMARGAELGRGEAARTQMRFVAALFEARSRVDGEAAIRMDAATSVALNGLASIVPAPSADVSVRTGSKRAADVLSPVLDGNTSRSALNKIRRAAVAPSPLRVLAAAGRFKSPRKARSGLKSSILSRQGGPSSERKSVVWRDEAHEGWELEEEPEAEAMQGVEPLQVASTPVPAHSFATMRAADTPDAPPIERVVLASDTSTDTAIASPLSMPPPPPVPSTSKLLPPTSSSSSGAQLAALLAKRKDSIAPKPFSFLQRDPHAAKSSRPPFSEVGNTSASSLPTPLAAIPRRSMAVQPSGPRSSVLSGSSVRRQSSLGPMRSVKKPRRVSFLATTAAAASTSDSGADASRSASISPAVMRRTSPLKKGSLIGGGVGGSSGAGAVGRRSSLAPGRFRRGSVFTSHPAPSGSGSFSNLAALAATGATSPDAAGSSARPVWR